MNILLLVGEFPPTLGGLANYSYNIAKYLRKNNTVNISIPPSHASVKKYPTNFQYVTSVGKRLTELKKTGRIEIVYAITFRPQFSAIGLRAKLSNLPFVSHGIGLDIYDFQALSILTRKIAYSISDYIICGARFQKEIMQDEGAMPEKIRVISGGVDVETYQPKYVEREPFKKFLGAEDKFILLSLGRLVRRKGFDDAIRALTYLDDIKNLLLLIAGDGPEKPFLTKLAQTLSLEEKVKFLGLVSSDHMPKIYNIADLFVAPFRVIGRDLEGFPLVVLEAQASGVPVISTNTAGVPELVENGKSGFLVQMNSPRKIAEKIRLFYDDRRLRNDMAKRARKRAEELFDWKVVIAKIEDVLQTALTKK